MSSFRAVPGIAVLACGLAACNEATVEQAKWDPDACNSILSNAITNIEDSLEDLDDAYRRMAEAQRVGDAEEVTRQTGRIENFRTVGIKEILEGVDERMPHCDEARLDGELVAQLAALRDAGNEPLPEVALEQAPELAIAGVTNVFVPFVTEAGGGCTGPYVDFAISIVNRGGDYPRPGDVEQWRATMGQNAETVAYFTVIMELDYGNSLKGYQQIALKAADLADGIASGATRTLPLRMPVADNQKQARIAVRVEAPRPLAIGPDSFSSAIYESSIEIPIWDLYTQFVETVSGPDRQTGAMSLASRMSVINKGSTPTPGPVLGSMTYRHAADGPSIGSYSAKSTTPVESGVLILAGKPVPAEVKPPYLIETNVVALCPDGSFGKLADGNIDDNARVLTEN